jgi:hypothetical protein
MRARTLRAIGDVHGRRPGSGNVVGRAFRALGVKIRDDDARALRTEPAGDRAANPRPAPVATTRSENRIHWIMHYATFSPVRVSLTRQ